MGDEIEQIKERINVAELVSEYVALRQVGQHLKGLCPFHQEKTPSFIVSPAKGIWHCFGCGTGGDIFAFIQKIESTDFRGSLEMLAERAGVELRKHSAENRDERQRLFEALALAGRFYHEILMNQPAGKKAQEYLLKRGVKKETMETFQLGYAPPAWDSIQRFLKSKGFNPVELEAAGLIGQAGTGRLFDRFRGRITFPVADLQGRIIAFGGRITPFTETGREGKYINTPETRLYSKRQTVYNLHRAKQFLRHQEPCLVVEGYMDVVMLAQAGVQTVVASSGTAFTPEHLQQLSRFTHTLHFAFDADAAGWKAALSATRTALAAGMRVATVQFPGGKDPADVVLEHPDAIQSYVSQPQSLVSIMVGQLKTITDPSQLETHLTDLLPFITTVKNPIQQGEMIQEIATRLHIAESQIIAMVQQAEQKKTEGAASPSLFRSSSFSSSSLSYEQYLMGLLLTDPVARQSIFPQLSPEVLLDARIQELYKLLQQVAETQTDFFTMTIDTLLPHFPAEAVPFAEGLRAMIDEVASQPGFSYAVEAKTVFQAVQRRALEKQLAMLQRQLAEATTSDRTPVLKRFQSVAEELERVRAQQ